MLKRLKVSGFKSLRETEISFPRLTVLFGPNAAGKSNLLDAVQALSRIGTSRTLSDALSEPIRGYPIESFSFPQGGLPELLSLDAGVHFDLEADVSHGSNGSRFRYRVSVGIQPASGTLSLKNEYLTALSKSGTPKERPPIELQSDQLYIRRKGKPAHPRQEPIDGNHSMLSDLRFSGDEYRAIELCRNELSAWRTYYLDPRVAMRAARSPADVTDIGVLGEDIAPFLYRLSAEKPKHFESIKRTLRSLIPSVEDLAVDLDKRRGTLDIQVKQAGIEFSSRIVSEGTLRVLALCAIAVNPWAGLLLAFEEPENGVHPRRIELIAKLLCSLAIDQGRQVIVTTHSPLFCDAILQQKFDDSTHIGLFNVRRRGSGTQITPFTPAGPLFKKAEIEAGLASELEDGLFEQLMLRGMLDE